MKREKEKKKPDYKKNITLMRLKDIFSDGLPALVKWNFLFFICCIPVITIGPALAALYNCVNLLVRNEQPQQKAGRLYVNSFKAAFKKTFVFGLFILIAELVFTTGFYLYITMSADNMLFLPLASVSLLAIILIYSIYCHYFPLVFESTDFSTGASVVSEKSTKEILSAAVHSAIENMKKTLFSAVLSVVVYTALMLFFPASIPLIITIGLIVPAVAGGFAHTEPEKEMYIIG